MNFTKVSHPERPRTPPPPPRKPTFGYVSCYDLSPSQIGGMTIVGEHFQCCIQNFQIWGLMCIFTLLSSLCAKELQV